MMNIDEKDILQMLTDTKNCIEWFWNNTELPEDKKHLQSDLFNIPANALHSIDLIETYIKNMPQKYTLITEL